MEYVEFDSNWNIFFIPISRNEHELESAYIHRVSCCLTSFYEKYTIRAGIPPKRFDLRGEMNFAEMGLERLCDVKFVIRPIPFGSHGEGIQVYSHVDNKDFRTPMLEYLKQAWTDFDYIP